MTFDEHIVAAHQTVFSGTTEKGATTIVNVQYFSTSNVHRSTMHVFHQCAWHSNMHLRLTKVSHPGDNLDSG